MSAPSAGSVAIVVPWYGEQLRGGAETVARQVALRLAARGHAVEVLTTCCRAFLEDWSVNHLPAGESRDGQVVVRRFQVGGRDSRAFDAANGQLMALPRSMMTPGTVVPDPGFAKDNIDSPDLHRFLATEGKAYRRVLFTPYLYGIMLNGAAALGARAILQPCLHDESYAYLDTTVRMFHAVRRCAFLSDGEADLAERLYGPAVVEGSLVVGSGIETEELEASVAARGDLGGLVPGNFLLYLGRRDATKGCDLLVEAWKIYRAAHPDSTMRLVLVGPGPTSYADADLGIIDRGLVDVPTKALLLRSCRALVHASRNESYSRSLMEAWHVGRPAVIHRDCPATAGAMDRAQGGWDAGDAPAEWARVMARIAEAPEEELHRLGRAGAEYAAVHADWERCIDRYEAVLGLRNEGQEEPAVPATPRRRAIDQVVTGFDIGDAISEEAVAIQAWLRGQGYESDIVAQYVHETLREACVQWKPGLVRPDRGLIYHHSIGAEINNEAIAHPGPKSLIYHNITPPAFFAPYKPDLARLLQSGLDDLPRAAASFPNLLADSAFNAHELTAATGRPAQVLPLPVPPAKWAVAPDQPLLGALRQDGVRNLLFVGRIAPNKCQHDLVRMFYHLLRMGVNARLCLVGQALPGDAYVAEVARLAGTLGIASRVWIPNKLSVPELAAAWAAADVFVSMSEHEGFGVPLVEAMFFNVPVVAFACTAIPETLADAGVTFGTKGDLVESACLVHEVLTDRVLRRRILARQRARRTTFLPSAVSRAYRELLIPPFL